jgi:cation diffusion facilitator family transporter
MTVQAPPRSDRLLLAAFASLAVAALVTSLKFVAYWRTGSVALYSDALESIVNLATAAMAIYAVRVAQQPADGRHQFGHHKAEYFSAIIEGALIVVAAVLILREAWEAFVRPRALTNLPEGMAIGLVAGVINAGWSAFLIRWGGMQRSPALIAGGWHLLTDVATTVGVLLGLVLAMLGGWPWLDPVLAVIVALGILWVGWRIVAHSVAGLMDEAVAPETARRIQATIAANSAGALEVHDVRTRAAASACFIEFHMVVPGSMTVAASHAICDRLELALEQAVPGAQVVIHVEPEVEAKRPQPPQRQDSATG